MRGCGKILNDFHVGQKRHSFPLRRAVKCSETVEPVVTEESGAATQAGRGEQKKQYCEVKKKRDCNLIGFTFDTSPV